VSRQIDEELGLAALQVLAERRRSGGSQTGRMGPLKAWIALMFSFVNGGLLRFGKSATGWKSAVTLDGK
jgi:hypothetical protein